MSKKRRPKSEINYNTMSPDNQEQEATANVADVTAIEPAVEIPAVEEEPSEDCTETIEASVSEESVTAVEPIVNEPIAGAEHVVDELDVKIDAPLVSPSDILLGVFSKRIIDAIDQALWASAVDAVKQGRMVLLKGGSPHVFITQDVFDPDAKLPSGVSSPASVLNNLLAGIV